jgi:lipopolysaccharide transport system permease protein
MLTAIQKWTIHAAFDFTDIIRNIFIRLVKSLVRIFALAFQFFNLPALLRNLYHHREAIRILTWRDFRGRFQGSIGGLLWPIIQPLFMMTIYTLVFSTFLKVRFGSSDSPFTFAVYLMCGLLPWMSFSEGITASANLIRSNQNLVKRVVFPLEVLPLNITLVAIIQQMISLLLLIPLAILVTGQFNWTIALLPVVLVFQIMLLTGVNWFWSSLSVYIPDLRQFTTLLVMMLMFLTPIFYPESIVPEQARFLIQLNPMARIIKIYRSIFMEGVLPEFSNTLITLAACFIIFLFGYLWFMRSKKHFPDFL